MAMTDNYYANTAARLNTIIGDAGVEWMKVNRAKQEYDSVDHPKESFYVWLQEQYGLKLQFTPDGDLKLSNEIIDDLKYTIFLLKFTEL